MSSRKRSIPPWMEPSGTERKKKKRTSGDDVVSLPRVLPIDTDDEADHFQLTNNTRPYVSPFVKRLERLQRKAARKQKPPLQPPATEDYVVKRRTSTPKRQRTITTEHHVRIHRGSIFHDDNDASGSETPLLPKKRKRRRRIRDSSSSPPVSPSPSSESSSSVKQTSPRSRKRSKLRPANPSKSLLSNRSTKRFPPSLGQYNSVLAQCTDPTIVSPSPAKTKTKKKAKGVSESSTLMSIFAEKQDEPSPPTKSKRKPPPPRKAKEKTPPRTYRKALRTSPTGDSIKASTFTNCMRSIVSASNPHQYRILHNVRERLRNTKLDATVYQRSGATTADPSTLKAAREERKRLERQVAALRTKERPKYHRALPVVPPVVVAVMRPANVQEFVEALEEESSSNNGSGDESEEE